jgi:hypothetical protein
LTACTWNPADVGSSITLSAGNLTWVSTTGTRNLGRSTLGYPTGPGTWGSLNNSTLKLYYEATAGFVDPANGPQMGFSNSNATSDNSPSTAFLGQGENGIGLAGAAGAVYQNFALIVNYFAYATGDVIGAAVDFFNQKIWWTKNGTTWNNDIIANQNPANNTGGYYDAFLFGNGTYLTLYAAFGSLDSGDGMGPANFGATPFTHPVPSGFAPWAFPYDPTRMMFLLSP